MQLICLGDSLTLGVNDAQSIGWPARLLHLIDSSNLSICYNLGVRASTTPHIKDRWSSEVTARINYQQNHLLIFSFAIADYIHSIPLKKSISCADTILETAINRYNTIFIASPPCIDKKRLTHTIKISQAIFKTCEKNNIPFFNLTDKLLSNKKYMEILQNTDGIHPTAEGYEIIAHLIFEFLKTNNYAPSP